MMAKTKKTTETIIHFGVRSETLTTSETGQIPRQYWKLPAEQKKR